MESEFFEWDDWKAATNVRKHRIDFFEAMTVFEDPYVVLEADLEHSREEIRATAIGFSLNSRVLLVVYTERVERTRIISARKATADERRRYESQFRETESSKT